jgi:hypothetical protein
MPQAVLHETRNVVHMKKLILILLGALLIGLIAADAAKADCDAIDPGSPFNHFE